MAIVSYGTVDGQLAKIVYHPDRGQKHIYWGGIRRPDDDFLGHNHMTIQDSNPDAAHYLRVGNTLVVDHSYNPNDPSARRRRAAFDLIAIFRQAWHNALRMYGFK